MFRQAERRISRLPPFERGPARFALHYGGKYAMGIGSYGLPDVRDWNEGSTLRIGAFCSIAENVQILLGGHHHSEWLSTYPFSSMLGALAGVPDNGAYSRGDVVIGSDVWLCSGSLILSGCTIGHGAVVGAGAVVTADVEPYSVVAGNPARHVRWRFAETVRQTLLELAWWEWPVEDIVGAAPILCSANVQSLIDYARQRGLLSGGSAKAAGGT